MQDIFNRTERLVGERVMDRLSLVLSLREEDDTKEKKEIELMIDRLWLKE